MNGRFMLDTDIVSFAIRGRGRVSERIVQHQPPELCISAITVAELRYGADRLGARRLHESIDRFIGDFEILPFNEACTRTYGTIANELAKRGTPICDFDVLIAAHAVNVDATLVTNNVKHFSRVAGLRVENWF